MYLVTIINDNVETVINAVSTDIDAPRLRSGTIKQGINCINSFTFSILPNNPAFHNIYPFKSYIKVLNTKTNKYEFLGRPLLPKPSMSDSGLISKTVVCESEIAYLQDTTQNYGEYHNMTVRGYFEMLINNHNKDIEDYKKFTIGNVNVEDNNDSVYRYSEYDTTWKNIESDLIDKLGGELQIRHENNVMYLDYLKEIGRVCNTPIKVRHNMKSIEENPSFDIGTRIVFLGAKLKSKDAEGNEVDTEERLTIKELNNGKDYLDHKEGINKFGIIKKIVIYEDVTEVKQLYSKARNYINSMKINISDTITALDLALIGLDIDTFEVGNYYPIVHEFLGINALQRIIEKSIDIKEPQKNTITLGERQTDLKSYTIKQQKKLVVKLNLANKKISQLQNTINANKVIEITPDDTDVEVETPIEPPVDEENLDDSIEDEPNKDITEEEEEKDDTGNNIVPPTTTEKNIKLVLKNNRIYSYDVLTYLKLLLPSTIKTNFKSKIRFITPTQASPLKFYQSKLLTLNGDDCINGALIPHANTEYIISVEYGSKGGYVGTVKANRDSGYYTYKSFKGANDVVNIAKDYITNKSLFKYGHTTIFTEGVKDKGWIENSKNNIDCSTGTGLWYRGRKYKNSKYFKSTFGNGARTDLYSWVFSLPRTAAEQANYCMEQGWYLTDYGKNYNKCKKGDLIFWSDRPTSTSQSVLAKRFMRISHVAIIGGVDADGDIITYEVTSSSNVIQSRKLKNQPGKVVLIARPGQ